MKPSELLQQVALKNSELRTKMEEIGVADDLLRIESEKIGKFIGNLSEKCFNQLTYDVYTNVPTGVLTRDEVSGNALKSGIVSALGNLLDWDIDATLKFCADLCDDVNAHEEAGMLRALVEKYQHQNQLQA